MIYWGEVDGIRDQFDPGDHNQITSQGGVGVGVGAQSGPRYVGAPQVILMRVKTEGRCTDGRIMLRFVP